MRRLSICEDRPGQYSARMLCRIALISISDVAPPASAVPAMAPKDSDDPLPKDKPEASLSSDIVFHHYCAFCHGMNADGQGRAAVCSQVT